VCRPTGRQQGTTRTGQSFFQLGLRDPKQKQTSCDHVSMRVCRALPSFSPHLSIYLSISLSISLSPPFFPHRRQIIPSWLRPLLQTFMFHVHLRHHSVEPATPLGPPRSLNIVCFGGCYLTFHNGRKHV
jgi:hypothetical protein